MVEEETASNIFVTQVPKPLNFKELKKGDLVYTILNKTIVKAEVFYIYSGLNIGLVVDYILYPISLDVKDLFKSPTDLINYLMYTIK